MRILFMGTPDFAVASLRRLVEDGHTRSAACSPSRTSPKTGATSWCFYACKGICLDTEYLPVYQPTKLRDGDGPGAGAGPWPRS